MMFNCTYSLTPLTKMKVSNLFYQQLFATALFLRKYNERTDAKLLDYLFLVRRVVFSCVYYSTHRKYLQSLLNVRTIIIN